MKHEMLTKPVYPHHFFSIVTLDEGEDLAVEETLIAGPRLIIAQGSPQGLNVEDYDKEDSEGVRRLQAIRAHGWRGDPK